MKHISIRVPWHDNKWNGTICQCPKNNPFCMMLHNISERKDENKEETYAGKDWNSLKQDQLPACVGENGGFMNEKPYKRIFKHVYAFGETPHAKLLPTTIELKPYSFFGIPFRYLSRDYQEELNHKYPNMSDDETAPFPTSWVYGKERQFEILNHFRLNIEAGTSLGVFYCKSGNPIDEDIIRKTKCFDFWERNVLFPKTKRSFFRTPKHPLPCPFPLNFSLLIITKKFGNLAKNRYICIV